MNWWNALNEVLPFCLTWRVLPCDCTCSAQFSYWHAVCVLLKTISSLLLFHSPNLLLYCDDHFFFGILFVLYLPISPRNRSHFHVRAILGNHYEKRGELSLCWIVRINKVVWLSPCISLKHFVLVIHCCRMIKNVIRISEFNEGKTNWNSH